MFLTRTLICSLWLAPLALGTQAPGQRFKLESVSVQQAQVWPLNREFLFSFNEALDFSTVNLNTVRIVNVADGSFALGGFTLRSDSELVFQPACPTQADLGDTGLEPGATYQLFVPDATNSAVMLLAESGKRLAEGAQVTFLTPNSNVLSELFDDLVAGPPTIVVAPDDDGSSLRTGAGVQVFFESGAGSVALPPAGFLAPNNLYSDAESRVSIHVRMSETLLPGEANINSERIRLQYQDSANNWITTTSKVSLLQDCGSGSTLVITPQGVLPQDRRLRVSIGSGLQDIVGNPTPLALQNLRFDTQSFLDENSNPIRFADEVFEGFEVGAPDETSLEDDQAPLVGVPAEWGSGLLTSTNGFPGTGGPGGDFDFHAPPGTVMIIDTTSQVLVGGPDGIPTTTQLVIGGVVDVNDFRVPADSKVLFSGPNPATILATGEVEILGTISVDGFDANPVFTLNNPTQPEPGAAGNCGGGAGGVGSFETTQVTQRGGNGQGAFGVPNGGGEGGESGWSPVTSSGGIMRRAAGGGGGRFGYDQRFLLGPGDVCPDQSVYGLDAESGFPGAPTAMSSQGAHFPYGGHAGDSPFVATPSLRDDFFGRAIAGFQGPNPSFVTGELTQPWAGAGGGAGGDATFVPLGQNYPPPTLVAQHQDKGAGGGGGAGSIAVYAKGDVIFGALGQLTAIGGHGSGGENTSGINRIGGGSGGGSGGHIIVQTNGTLDLSRVAASNQAIDARGGQGGEGENGRGGASVNETTMVSQDAKHIGANNGFDNPWEVLSPACESAMVGERVVSAAGGDGGPGLVQLHVKNLAGQATEHDISYPGSGSVVELASAVRPVPVGFDAGNGNWRDQLLLDTGMLSQAQSKWLALGVPQAAPGSAVRDTLEFLLDGTDPGTGFVRETGGTVDPLPLLLAPASPIEAQGLPNIATSDLIYFDAAGLSGANQIFAENPGLLRGFDLEIAGQARPIESATILSHGSIDVLAVSVDSSGGPLGTSGFAAIRPRYFRVFSAGIPDAIAAGASVQIELQAAAADANGQPDPASIFPGTTEWATDPALLTNHPANADFRFLRFRVSFDGTDEPLSLGELKLPIGF